MEKIIEFEGLLYDQFTELKAVDIGDIDFWVDRIANLPCYRCFKLDKAVNLSVGYCKIDYYREKLLTKSNICPVLIYRLY